MVEVHESNHILVVDDEPENLAFVARALRGHGWEVITAGDADQALEQLRRHRFAVIVADQRMPGLTGVELLAMARELTPDSTRILLTGFADVDSTIDAINHSRVSAFLRKPIASQELVQAVETAFEIFDLRMRNASLLADLQERNLALEQRERMLEMSLDERSREVMRMYKQLEHLVAHDGLTGLYNHRHLQERAEQELARARRHGLDLTVILLDIDRFKEYNDLNGHSAGDQALVDIARLLSEGASEVDQHARVRGTDIVARYGGEEFVILLPDTPIEGGYVLAERLREAIAHRPFAGEEQMSSGCLTVSVGVASYPRDAQSRSELIRRADQALHAAKTGGRNRVCLYGEL